MDQKDNNALPHLPLQPAVVASTLVQALEACWRAIRSDTRTSPTR